MGATRLHKWQQRHDRVLDDSAHLVASNATIDHRDELFEEDDEW